MNASLRIFLLTATLGALPCSLAMAQPSVGVVGGFNIAKISFDAGAIGTTSLETQYGQFGGLTFTQSLLPGLSVEIDGLFIQGGAGQAGDDYQLRLGYVSVPVMARVDVPLIYRRRLHLTVGPSLNFKLYESIRVDGDEDTDLDAYKRLEASVVVGGGVDIGRLRVLLRFSRGLTDIVSDSRLAQIPFALKNSWVMFGVGYTFNEP